MTTDFVGTQFGADPAGGFRDGEHEGHPGYTIAGVEGLLRGPSKDALARFRPDIITVLLGTNDIGQGQLAGADTRLRSLVELLLHSDPRSRIIVGTIPPILPFAFSGYGDHGADVPVYNRAVYPSRRWIRADRAGIPGGRLPGPPADERVHRGRRSSVRLRRGGGKRRLQARGGCLLPRGPCRAKGGSAAERPDSTPDPAASLTAGKRTKNARRTAPGILLCRSLTSCSSGTGRPPF